MTLVLTLIKPPSGGTQGGNLVRLEGPTVGGAAAVCFDNLPARIIERDAGGCIVSAPEHDSGTVDVTAHFGERSETAREAYRYARPDIAPDTDLARAVRALLRDIRRHVMARTLIAVDVAYAGPCEDGETPLALAKLPALVLTGPALRPNRIHRRADRMEVPGPNGTVLSYLPPSTFDLAFTLTGSTMSLGQMLNLMGATVAFTSSRHWLAIDRDTALPEAGRRRWRLIQQGEARSHIDDREGVRSFSLDFIIEAFDIEASQPTDLSTPAPDVEVGLENGVSNIA